MKKITSDLYIIALNTAVFSNENLLTLPCNTTTDAGYIQLLWMNQTFDYLKKINARVELYLNDQIF